MTRKIQLTQRKFALVSDEDYEHVSKHRWHAVKMSRKYNILWYANSGTLGRMHNFIMRPTGNMEVDHKNGNGLDNRRSNLRLRTHRQNTMNRHNHSGHKSWSGYRGVHWQAGVRHWIVVVADKLYGRISLGSFMNKRVAARAYDAKMIEFHGEFANLNFPRRSRRDFSSKQRRTF